MGLIPLFPISNTCYFFKLHFSYLAPFIYLVCHSVILHNPCGFLSSLVISVWSLIPATPTYSQPLDKTFSIYKQEVLHNVGKILCFQLCCLPTGNETQMCQSLGSLVEVLPFLHTLVLPALDNCMLAPTLRYFQHSNLDIRYKCATDQVFSYWEPEHWLISLTWISTDWLGFLLTCPDLDFCGLDWTWIYAGLN